jgi:hypothetical protein
LARDHDKIVVNPDLTLTVVTPPTVPPPLETAKQLEFASVKDFMNTNEQKA